MASFFCRVRPARATAAQSCGTWAAPTVGMAVGCPAFSRGYSWPEGLEARQWCRRALCLEGRVRLGDRYLVATTVGPRVPSAGGLERSGVLLSRRRPPLHESPHGGFAEPRCNLRHLSVRNAYSMKKRRTRRTASQVGRIPGTTAIGRRT